MSSNSRRRDPQPTSTDAGGRCRDRSRGRRARWSALRIASEQSHHRAHDLEHIGDPACAAMGGMDTVRPVHPTHMNAEQKPMTPIRNRQRGRTAHSPSDVRPVRDLERGRPIERAVPGWVDGVYPAAITGQVGQIVRGPRVDSRIPGREVWRCRLGRVDQSQAGPVQPPGGADPASRRGCDLHHRGVGVGIVRRSARARPQWGSRTTLRPLVDRSATSRSEYRTSPTAPVVAGTDTATARGS